VTTDNIKCLFCSASLKDANVVTFPDSPEIALECPRCFRRRKVGGLFWLTQGLKVDQTPELRCPFCYKLFVRGEYSDRPQQVKCRSCGGVSVFVRVPTETEAIGAPLQQKEVISNG
jgi:phage FluMu protein Com